MEIRLVAAKVLLMVDDLEQKTDMNMVVWLDLQRAERWVSLKDARKVVMMVAMSAARLVADLVESSAA